MLKAGVGHGDQWAHPGQDSSPLQRSEHLGSLVRLQYELLVEVLRTDRKC